MHKASLKYQHSLSNNQDCFQKSHILKSQRFWNQFCPKNHEIKIHKTRFFATKVPKHFAKLIFSDEEKYDVYSSKEFASKETDDFDDVSFINENDRIMNDLLISNKSIGHPYPISFSSSSSAIKCLKVNFNLKLFLLFFFNKCRWLFS